MRFPRPGAWLRAHARTAREVATGLAAAWLNTALAALVLGITLALPALGLLGAESLARASAGLDASPQLSAYLRVPGTDAQARELAKAVRAWPDVAATDVITADQARAQMAAATDLGPLLALLDDNPLPATVVVHPAPAASADAVAALGKRLGEQAHVQHVQSDVAWVARLHAGVALTRRAVAVLAALLALAVVLVTGNTIRLAILARREEIEILKLVGGTDAFVRRPFLWFGALQGLSGALVALVLVVLARGLLAGPAAHLAQLYGSSVELATLGAGRALAMLAIGAGLGLAGAWLAVTRHLRDIQPR